MRISDDRYTRDRLRLDLALRLIHHEARTCTIRQWTGLSDDRIRKLYRSYVADRVADRDAAPVSRHRGKSPRQTAFFFRNAEMHFEAVQLTSLYLIHGLLEATVHGVESRYRVGSVDSGLLVCRVYETYEDLHAPAHISFEHAWFLLWALARHTELGVARCASCGGLRLRDLLARRAPACANCAPVAAKPAPSRPAKESTAPW